MEDKTLEILVVEDREENRRGAQEYFDTITNVRVDFATNYNDGLQKLQEGSYAVGIFDLELPRTEGDEPEKLGFELGYEAQRLAIPYCIITGGRNHGIPATAIYPMGNEKLCKITRQNVDKTYPEAWKNAYESILEACPVDALLAARERYKKYLGKSFRGGLVRRQKNER